MQKDFMEDAAFEQDFSVLEFFFFLQVRALCVKNNVKTKQTHLKWMCTCSIPQEPLQAEGRGL